jgi:hypothetical protein
MRHEGIEEWNIGEEHSSTEERKVLNVEEEQDGYSSRQLIDTSGPYVILNYTISFWYPPPESVVALQAQSIKLTLRSAIKSGNFTTSLRRNANKNGCPGVDPPLNPDTCPILGAFAPTKSFLLIGRLYST